MAGEPAVSDVLAPAQAGDRVQASEQRPSTADPAQHLVDRRCSRVRATVAVDGHGLSVDLGASQVEGGEQARGLAGQQVHTSCAVVILDPVREPRADAAVPVEDQQQSPAATLPLTNGVVWCHGDSLRCTPDQAKEMLREHRG